jgi:hypothetical protein
MPVIPVNKAMDPKRISVITEKIGYYRVDIGSFKKVGKCRKKSTVKMSKKY